MNGRDKTSSGGEIVPCTSIMPRSARN